MDKIKSILNTYMLGNAVLSTLEDCSTGMPESTVYIALGSNYDLSTRLIGMLQRQGAIQVKSHYITKGENFDKILKNCRDGEATIRKLLKDKGIVL